MSIIEDIVKHEYSSFHLKLAIAFERNETALCSFLVRWKRVSRIVIFQLATSRKISFPI
jgi:hypothetical protein